MFVSDILQNKGTRVVAVTPDETLASAIATLSARRIGAVLVLDVDKSLVGILSERDILHALARRAGDAFGLRVEEVMTTPVVTCGPDHTVEHVMALMTEGRFRHLPVVQRGVLMGIVSIGDVVKWRLDETRQEAEDLRQYIAT
ncbi:CBS domain-containing protein [Vineibacter terrae]|uniref:CBS domain-containing protein n=1 Tax=Vineibacter terrae TaxID=2586908 RepID=A0A5C8P9B1_9HYPH|nr:CBS domain-containing protein [Vineibacter terrae]TXL70377.1 CBS domain-containing protein [Vineibacter terrae]